MAALTCVASKCVQHLRIFTNVRQSYCVYRTNLLSQTLQRKTRRFNSIRVCATSYSTQEAEPVRKLTDEIANIGNVSAHASTDQSKHEEKKEKDKPKQGSWKRFKTWYEKQSTSMKTFVVVGIGGFTLVTVGGWLNLLYIYASPARDPEGNVIEDEFTGQWFGYARRLRKEVKNVIQETQEPSRPKLLPDPLQYPYIQPRYTLVLEMTDIFVHPEWTFSTGWRWKKRPGIEQFLRAVGPPLFEVVIYTADQGFTADPILTKIDLENYIMYRLYKDATHYYDSHHVKDLSYLNRDLSRVIMVDWNPKSYQLNPDNGFQMKRWQGEDSDVALHDLAQFLRALAASGVEDVRPVLKHYSQFEDPLEQFRQNQQKLKEYQDEQAKIVKEQEKSKISPSRLRTPWRR